MAGRLTDGTVTAGRLTGGTLTAGTLTAGTLTAGRLIAGALTAGRLTDGTLTDGRLTDGVLIDGTLIVGRLTDGTVTAGRLTDGTLTAGTLTAGTDGTLTDGALTGGTLTDGALIGGALTDGALIGGAPTDGAGTDGGPRGGRVFAGAGSYGGSTAEAATGGIATAGLGRGGLPAVGPESGIAIGGTVTAGAVTVGVVTGGSSVAMVTGGAGAGTGEMGTGSTAAGDVVPVAAAETLGLLGSPTGAAGPRLLAAGRAAPGTVTAGFGRWIVASADHRRGCRLPPRRSGDHRGVAGGRRGGPCCCPDAGTRRSGDGLRRLRRGTRWGRRRSGCAGRGPWVRRAGAGAAPATRYPGGPGGDPRQGEWRRRRLGGVRCGEMWTGRRHVGVGPSSRGQDLVLGLGRHCSDHHPASDGDGCGCGRQDRGSSPAAGPLAPEPFGEARGRETPEQSAQPVPPPPHLPNEKAALGVAAQCGPRGIRLRGPSAVGQALEPYSVAAGSHDPSLPKRRPLKPGRRSGALAALPFTAFGVRAVATALWPGPDKAWPARAAVG